MTTNSTNSVKLSNWSVIYPGKADCRHWWDYVNYGHIRKCRICGKCQHD